MSTLPISRSEKFNNELRKEISAHKKQGLTEAVICRALEDIGSGKAVGDRCRGYGPYEVRKLRRGYGNVSKRKGARIVYGVLDDQYVAMSIYMANADDQKKRFPVVREEVHQAIQAQRKSKAD